MSARWWSIGPSRVAYFPPSIEELALLADIQIFSFTDGEINFRRLQMTFTFGEMPQ